jgi:hypothetical protein
MEFLLPNHKALLAVYQSINYQIIKFSVLRRVGVHFELVLPFSVRRIAKMDPDWPQK